MTSSMKKWVLVAIGLAGVAYVPFSGIPSSVVGSANLAATYTLIAVSLVLLTGWVGQISLGHAALVGVGAYATGWAAGGFQIPFPMSLLVAIGASAAVAALLGVVALRVRGLYLAVATLVFSWMASEFLFRQKWFILYDHIPDRLIGGKGWFPTFDFTDRRIFYLTAWATAIVGLYLAANLRESKTGRAFFAVRGSEMAAASLGIDVMRTKLLAFATSGAMAGAAGNLLMSGARVVTADQFTFTVSLFFLSIAVVGGLANLGGAVASALVFAGLTEVFFRVSFLGGFLEIVSGLLLGITLLVYPGGLAALTLRVRELTAGMLKGRFKVARRARFKEPQAPRRVRRRLVARSARSARGARPSGALTRLGLNPFKMFAERSRRRRQRQAFAVSAGSSSSGSSGVSKLTAPVAKLLRSFKILPKRKRGPRVRVKAEAPIDFDALSPQSATDAEQAALESALAGNGHRAEDDQPMTLDAFTARTADFSPTGPRENRRALVEAKNIVVRFGGLTAVNNASLAVREGEIVGLIGPNGAGKTTLFNSIAGFNTPAEGTINLYGHDVTDLPVHRRASVGVARTFQVIQLFHQLSVFDNLLVATHVHNPTGYLHHLVVTERSIEKEIQARHRVERVLELLELKDIAERKTADLPFGVLRMVEVARALVTGFKVMMLDEPASGLDNKETDRLMDVVRFVRSLGVTILLIEHDVRMVTGVSDYMYVLDQGQIIAQGSSAEIQADPKVIAAYLGEPAGEKEKAGV